MPQPRPPSPLYRRDGRLWILTALGEAEIVPSHNDRRRARFWQVRLAIAASGIQPRARALTPWLPTPSIAAHRALSIAADNASAGKH